MNRENCHFQKIQKKDVEFEKRKIIDKPFRMEIHNSDDRISHKVVYGPKMMANTGTNMKGNVVDKK